MSKSLVVLVYAFVSVGLGWHVASSKTRYQDKALKRESSYHPPVRFAVVFSRMDWRRLRAATRSDTWTTLGSTSSHPSLTTSIVFQW